MRIVVVGRNGQLARSLACAATACNIITIGRPELDLEQGDPRPAIIAARPDIVLNAAAYTAVDDAEDHPDRAFRLNADVPGLLAEAAWEARARFVHVSTDYVFDGRGGRPYRETDPIAPIGVYGASKAAGETAVRIAHPAATIVRTAWVHSPFGRNFVKTMIALAATRDVLTVVDDQFGTPTSAADLAQGLLAFARPGIDPSISAGQTYHLAGSGDVVSWAGFASAVMNAAGGLGLPTAEIRPIPTSAFPTRARRPVFSALDSAAFANDIDFTMPDWRRSLTRVVQAIAVGQ